MTQALSSFNEPGGLSHRFRTHPDAAGTWLVVDSNTGQRVATFAGADSSDARDAARANAWEHEVRARNASVVYGPAPEIAQVVVNESSGNVNILGIRMDHDGGPVHATTTRLLESAPGTTLRDVEAALETHGWRIVTRARAAWALLAAGYALTGTPSGHLLRYQDADTATWTANPGAATHAFIARIAYGTPSGGRHRHVRDATITTYPRRDEPDSDDASEVYVFTVFGLRVTIRLILDPPAGSANSAEPCAHPHVHIDADPFREPNLLVAEVGMNGPLEYRL